jgi:hypothetical protein
MSVTVPVAAAKLTLLPELSHGRLFLATGQYRPHIVIGPQSQRVAIRDGNRFTEHYLGVMFVGGPDMMEPGDTAEVKPARTPPVHLLPGFREELRCEQMR